MSFYNKDRKYRKLFRNPSGGKFRMPSIAVLLFTVMIILIAVTPSDNPAAEAGGGENNGGSANIQADIPVKDRDAFKDILSGITGNSSGKDAYFPDYTPAEGVITDGYGPRTDPEPSFHRAIDIAGEFLSPIYAAADGEVIFCGSDEIYGLNVVIDHIHDGYKTKYAHMATYVVTEGMKIKKGDIIGFMGTTGYSTGVHLHFEIIQNDKKLDPAPFILIKDGRAVLR